MKGRLYNETWTIYNELGAALQMFDKFLSPILFHEGTECLVTMATTSSQFHMRDLLCTSVTC